MKYVIRCKKSVTHGSLNFYDGDFIDVKRKPTKDINQAMCLDNYPKPEDLISVILSEDHFELLELMLSTYDDRFDSNDRNEVDSVVGQWLKDWNQSLKEEHERTGVELMQIKLTPYSVIMALQSHGYCLLKPKVD